MVVYESQQNMHAYATPYIAASMYTVHCMLWACAVAWLYWQYSLAIYIYYVATLLLSLLQPYKYINATALP